MLPLSPASFAEHYNKARKLHSAGRLAEARALYEKLVEMAPERFEMHFQLAGIAWRERNNDEALEHLRRAQALKPDDPMVLRALADTLFGRGEVDEAIAIHESMIAATPKDAGPRIDRAHKLQRIGDFEAAEAELLRAMKLDPRRGEPYRMITAGRKMRPNEPLIGRMKKVLKDPKLGTTARTQIGFALAKAMEDTGKYDQVFRYLRPANAAVKKATGYRVDGRRQEVDRLIEAFSGYDFDFDEPGPEDFAPVFVTGLPRSGTTLVERILGSHSQVTAGGEMSHAVRIAFEVIGMPGRGLTPMTELTPAQLERIGQAYEKAVRHTIAFDRIVTDKAIQPHLIMGLLRKAIPGARFIVVRRDPRDGLYSIYKNMFAKGTHGYAYDLDDLAAYYATFVKIVDFWRAAMPGGFHEVQYEDLVADPETQSRALVAAAGLEWEDACLDFHKTAGPVRTLSVSQVRQPIYRSSSAIWRRYEKDLAPLIAALEREGVQLDGA